MLGTGADAVAVEFSSLDRIIVYFHIVNLINVGAKNGEAKKVNMTT